jgi:SAM-dependent methyltransferase
MSIDTRVGESGHGHGPHNQHGQAGEHGQHSHHGTASGHHGHRADAEGIAALLSEQRRASLPPEATLHAAGVREGHTVVDLGCGPGYFTLPAAELVGADGKVYGVDVQPEMVAACRQRAVDAGAQQVEVLHSSATRVPLPDGIADSVLASVVLHEAKDRVGFLREARRLLKPGGEVAVIEFRKDADTSGPPPARRLSAAELAQLAEAAGLRVRTQRALNDHLVMYQLAAASPSGRS